MEQVVSEVPVFSTLTWRIVSARVSAFSFDQASARPLPVLDRIAVRPASTIAATSSPQPVPLASPIASLPVGVYATRVTEADAIRFRVGEDDIGAVIGT